MVSSLTDDECEMLIALARRDEEKARSEDNIDLINAYYVRANLLRRLANDLAAL